jgi:cyanophycinase-like exopeptidase
MKKTVYLLSGGVLHHRKAHDPLLRERFEQGAVFAGFSAGSIMLSRQWVRWHDPADDASAEPFDCLGFVPLVCDMHDETDGWEELKTLLRLRRVPEKIGYGAPTSMGLRVHPDGRIEAVGGWVHRHIFRGVRVVNIGDIWPAFFVHPSEYEY